VSSPRILAFCIAIFAGWSLSAHEMGMAKVEVTFLKDGTYMVDLFIDRAHVPPGTSLSRIAQSSVLSFDGQRVTPAPTQVTNGAVTRLRMRGPTPVRVSRFTFANAAIEGFYALKLRNEGQETAVTQWVEGGKTSEPFPLDRAVIPKPRSEIVKQYLILGFTHILPKGLDHVLFVLGIFLLAVRLKPVLWQVTAFTLAHTITLALTIFGLVSLPASIVEPLIALSIAYVAFENVFTDKLHAWRPLIVFGFGLLHGMGFAGVLSEIGLPRSEFVPALLAFNVGVELGQLTVIFAAFVLTWPLRNKPWYRRRIVIPASLFIAVIALYWFIERIVA
jgi:hydrogenase/urease accessory protein HupE